MSIETRERAGFTKLGFTKASFSCCGHFSFCNMGKGDCFWGTLDPEAKEYCNCYQRNRRIKSANDNASAEVSLIVDRLPFNSHDIVEEEENEVADMEQLSLF